MKKKRQKRIIEIIRQFDVGTQEELAERLKSEGFSVTQATISRDIRELKLSKLSAEGGGLKYVALDQETDLLENRYVRVLREAYSSAESAQNIVVIKTVSGMAMAAAAALDAMKFAEIMGCIAGDDTIFVAVHTSEEARILVEKLHVIMAREESAGWYINGD